MKLSSILFVIALLIIPSILVAQTDIEKLVMEGIEHHDKGEYDKAIESYKKALKIDPNSPLVNYEIALSYFSNEDYKKAVKYSDAVLDEGSEYIQQAYVTKGSALDMMGKTKESIKVFEKAIKETEPNYLLYFNLALNYYRADDLVNAEENTILAIEQNPSHASSHLMLAEINNKKGNTVQTLLASNFFLLLEPYTSRSENAYNILMSKVNGNVSKDEEKPNTINIMLSGNNDSQFGAAELMISMLEASKSLEKNKGKTEDELFIEKLQSFFNILGDLKKEENKDIWWNFYVDFFYDLSQSEHMETYCKYITQIGNENSQKWLSEHEDKLTAFDKWINKKE